MQINDRLIRSQLKKKQKKNINHYKNLASISILFLEECMLTTLGLSDRGN